jgi:hypothetical protein
MQRTLTGGDDDLSPELLQSVASRFGLLASTMRLHIVWVLESRSPWM